MRSDDEILDDLARILQEGERDGSIHSNPPSKDYLKDMFPDKTVTDGESKTSTASAENSEDESQPAPLSKEQLGNLLNDFLDRLTASKPPAPASVDPEGNRELPEWMLFHVPHDSTCIPSSVRGQFLLNDAELNAELLRMTDHWTFDLFAQGVAAHQIVRAEVSRLVVDVERFDDDSQEIMAALGMGAIYQRSAHGSALRRLIRPDERESLMNTWYWPHHKQLEWAVEKALAAYGHALVIDAHSFPSSPLPYELDQRPDRPDICIGTDSFHTPKDLEEAFVTAFSRAGFGVSVNSPFGGALVPKRHYGQDKRVASVMIEVNRGLYMDEVSGDRLNDFAAVALALHGCINHAISMV